MAFGPMEALPAVVTPLSLSFLLLLVHPAGENGSVQYIYFEDSCSSGVRGLLWFPQVYSKCHSLWGFFTTSLGKIFHCLEDPSCSWST